MARIAINVLLIGAVLVCPLHCLASVCLTADASRGAVKSCCAHCASLLPQQSDKDGGSSGLPTNQPLLPVPSGGSSCICQGALAEATESLLSEQNENIHERNLSVIESFVFLSAATERRENLRTDLHSQQNRHRLCILHQVLLL